MWTTQIKKNTGYVFRECLNTWDRRLVGGLTSGLPPVYLCIFSGRIRKFRFLCSLMEGGSLPSSWVSHFSGCHNSSWNSGGPDLCCLKRGCRTSTYLHPLSPPCVKSVRYYDPGDILDRGETGGGTRVERSQKQLVSFFRLVNETQVPDSLLFTCLSQTTCQNCCYIRIIMILLWSSWWHWSMCTDTETSPWGAFWRVCLLCVFISATSWHFKTTSGSECGSI